MYKKVFGYKTFDIIKKYESVWLYKCVFATHQ